MEKVREKEESREGRGGVEIGGGKKRGKRVSSHVDGDTHTTYSKHFDFNSPALCR